MGKADLHIHTSHSTDGTATVCAVLEHVRANTDLDVIAITDHDTIDGALEALKVGPIYGVHVIPGIEVSTLDGDLLALWVTEPVPRGLPMLGTIRIVQKLGGLCIVPHPGLNWSWCASQSVLENLLRQPQIDDVLVGAEQYNASLPHLGGNRVSAELCRQLGLGEIANSDAHILSVIGCGATVFPGETPDDLRRALLAGSTRTLQRPRPRNFISLLLKQRLLRLLGYVHSAHAVPGASIDLRRASFANAGS